MPHLGPVIVAEKVSSHGLCPLINCLVHRSIKTVLERKFASENIDLSANVSKTANQVCDYIILSICFLGLFFHFSFFVFYLNLH